MCLKSRVDPGLFIYYVANFIVSDGHKIFGLYKFYAQAYLFLHILTNSKKKTSAFTRPEYEDTMKYVRIIR